MRTNLLTLSALFLLAATLHAQTTATWTAGSGNWSLGSNWNTGIAPINGQPLVGDTYNAVLSTFSTVTLDVPVSIQALTFSSGTINGSNALNVGGAMAWSEGTISGTNAATDIVNATGGLTLSSSSTKSLYTRTLNIGDGINAINTQWQGGTLDLRSNSVINNRVGSTFTAQFAGTIDNGANDTSTVNNEGTFTKSAGTGATVVDNNVVFNNSGTVHVKTGTLRLDGNGTHTGTFNMLSAGTLNLNSSTHILNAGTSFTGPGMLEISTLVTANAAVSIASGLTLNAGTMNGAGTYNISGAMAWTGGTISGTVAATHIVNATGGLTLSGSSTKSLYTRTLNIGDGVSPTTASWSDGILDLRANAVINNAAGSTFNNSFDGALNNGGGGGDNAIFNNQGIFNKTGGAGTTSTNFGLTFNNSGTVNVNSGTFAVVNGSHSGVFNMTSGNTLSFAAGSQTLNAGTSFSGAGTFSVSGSAAVTANADVGISSLLSLSSGEINGAGTYNVSGAMTWSGGAIRGTNAATHIVNATGGLTLSGASTKSLFTRTLNIGDGVSPTTASWSSGTLDLRANAVINNTAGSTFNNSFDGALNNGGGGGDNAIFNNQGIFNKTGGAGTTSTNFGLTFNNSGTVNVNSGTIQFNGVLTNSGSIDANDKALVINGGGSGAGSFNADAGGLVNFIGGTYVLNAGGTLNGTGTYRLSGVSSPVLTVAGNVSTANLEISSGTLNGSGAVTVSGGLAWSGGTMSGAGSTTLTAGSISSISGSDTKTLSTRALVYEGAGTQVTWSGTGNIQSDGSITVQNGALFDIQNNQVMGDGNNNTVSGTLVIGNGGTLRKSAGGGTSTIGGSLGFGGDTVNASVGSSGTVEVQSGTLAFANTVTNHSGTTLTGGTWNVSGGSTLAFNAGSNITTNAANVTLDGAGSSFAKFTTALNNNQGSLTLKNDRDLATAGAYANSGTTRVEGAGTVMTVGTGGNSAYTQSGAASVTVLSSGALVDASIFKLDGGALTGSGTIDSPFHADSVNSTFIRPGMLTVNGSTILGANNTLVMEIGGLSQGTSYDWFDVNGDTFMIGGQLQLGFVNGFQNSIAYGDMFTIGTADSDILGAFTNVLSGARLDTQDGYGSFAVYYGGGSPYGGNNLLIGEFLAVPEPSRSVLLFSGLLMSILRRSRLACDRTGMLCWTRAFLLR
jgi:hypothetical protein